MRLSRGGGMDGAALLPSVLVIYFHITNYNHILHLGTMKVSYLTDSVDQESRNNLANGYCSGSRGCSQDVSREHGSL